MSDELNSVNAEPAANVEPQQTEQTPVESAKEDAANPQQEKPVQSREDNAKFAEIRRKAEAEARDKLISEMYGESHGIHTYADYQRAVERQAEEQRKAALEKQGIDPSLVDEYVKNNPTVKWAESFKSEQEAKQFVDKNRLDFLTHFKATNERDFDPAKDQIPPEVWQQTELYEKSRGKEGKSLTDAYLAYENKQLRAKLKAQEVNDKNAESSPGSVTGNGETKTDFISREQFDANKSDQRWVIKNLTKITASRAKW